MKRSIGRISFDAESGDGHVKLSRDFLTLTALERADILKDIISILDAEYSRAVAGIFSGHRIEDGVGQSNGEF